MTNDVTLERHRSPEDGEWRWTSRPTIPTHRCDIFYGDEAPALRTVVYASHWDTGDWDAIPPHIPATPVETPTEPANPADDGDEEGEPDG